MHSNIEGYLQSHVEGLLQERIEYPTNAEVEWRSRLLNTAKNTQCILEPSE